MKRFLLPAVLVLAATGCAAQAPAAEPAPVTSTSEAPAVLKPGSFTFETATGAKGTISLPGKPDAGVEALRALGKGPKVTYVTVKVDNRQGTDGVNMYGISVFTPAGEELQYKNVDDYISSIRPSDAPAEIYNQFIDAGNKHGAMANPKSVKEFVMTGPAVPAEFTGVTVYPAGMSDPVEAVPAQ